MQQRQRKQRHSKAALKTVGIKTGFSQRVIGRLNALLKSTKGSLQEGNFILLFTMFISDNLRRAYEKMGVHTFCESHKTLLQLLVAPTDKPPDQFAGSVLLDGVRGLSKVLCRGIR